MFLYSSACDWARRHINGDLRHPQVIPPVSCPNPCSREQELSSTRSTRRLNM